MTANCVTFYRTLIARPIREIRVRTFAQNAARKFLPMQRKDFAPPACLRQVLDCFQKLQTDS